MAVQQLKFRIEDNPAVIESYANKLVGSFFDGGSVCLTFGALRLLPKKAGDGSREDQLPTVHVTHRLTLSPSAAVELAKGLNTILKALEQAQAQAKKAAQEDPALADSILFKTS